jgi:hypothetical protein
MAQYYYNKRDYINNVKWQTRQNNNEEKIEKYSGFRLLYYKGHYRENKNINDIFKLLIKLKNNVDYNIQPDVFKIVKFDVINKNYQWIVYAKNAEHLYKISKNKKNKYQLTLRSKYISVDATMFYGTYGMNFDEIEDSISHSFVNELVLITKNQISFCYNQLQKLMNNSVMENTINYLEDIV